MATDLQFEKFCTVLNLTKLVRDPRFKHNKERCKNFDALYEVLKQKIQERNTKDLAKVFE